MIGVLQEREDKVNNGRILEKSNEKSHNKNNNHKHNDDSNCKCRPTTQVPSPKLSAMDTSRILNCRRRLEWTKEWLRKNQHEFLNKENLRKELSFRSNERYHLNFFFKITEGQFRYLVKILEPVVSGLKPQRKRKAFSAEERIAITLKYLATGEVNSGRNYCFVASKPVILKMIADICQKMYEHLKDNYLSLPKRSEQWIPIINGMQQKHHLSNCLGHLIMQQITFYKPHNTPSRNRGVLWPETEDKTCSQNPPLILTAIVDDSYNFLYADVEKTKAVFPDEIFEKSKIRQLIEDNSIPIPTSIRKANGNCEACGFAGSLCLAEKSYLKSPQQPMSEQEFSAFQREGNDVLCMLCNIFPVLCRPLRLSETDAQKIILGSIALYNFLRKSDNDFCKLTESIVMGLEEQFVSLEDDDCIIDENEEERKERYEFMPHIQKAMWFKSLLKQSGGSITAVLESRNKQVP